jgi:hypothetical protein
LTIEDSFAKKSQFVRPEKEEIKSFSFPANLTEVKYVQCLMYVGVFLKAVQLSSVRKKDDSKVSYSLVLAAY